MQASIILFLDFDDVLNTRENLARGELFDPDKVQVLNRIAEMIEFEIVVTSTWRLGATAEELEELLITAGLHADGRVIGTTPYLEGETRGAEIMAWLQQTPKPVSNFAILDDRDDVAPFKSRLLQTRPGKGLCEEHIGELTEMLAA
ncbi:hypothetical protein DESUT3_24490 [Desulfuromonas versatilis]|uniref:Uncharacterized protein n=1 Tax=Desulfuromonas versatilis TaxID=2802975 RepID=A0ABM8HTS5_9BACT|nr:HAD domain-containing protein [Desulfuromonas versatilis]BCR05380.1 hypothetical protein DESUT3_24490 [Desulfuromonas versatilis]